MLHLMFKNELVLLMFAQHFQFNHLIFSLSQESPVNIHHFTSSKASITMKNELFRALERIGNLLVGNFTVSFQNELRFMVRRMCIMTPGIATA